MGYFDNWKVKNQNENEKNLDIQPKLTNNIIKPHTTSIENIKINNNIKIIDLSTKAPEVIDYSGPVKVEKINQEKKIIDLSSFMDSTFSINDKSLYVYTDGSCINNGKKNAKAGIGIYFGENDPRNVSRPVEGKQTNNVAELTAILVAMDILKNEIDEGRRIVIYTDSEYAIKCFTSYGRRLQSMGFLTKDPVPNLELIKEGLLKVKNNVFFQHIRSHTGNQDKHSLANEEADKLANKAIGIESKAPRIYLKVSYGNREQAKEMGAKWDSKKKSWYVHNIGHKAVSIFGQLTNFRVA